MFDPKDVPDGVPVDLGEKFKTEGRGNLIGNEDVAEEILLALPTVAQCLALGEAKTPPEGTLFTLCGNVECGVPICMPQETLDTICENQRPGLAYSMACPTCAMARYMDRAGRDTKTKLFTRDTLKDIVEEFDKKDEVDEDEDTEEA